MIRVAFASTDNEHVDMHFGAAERLLVFEIARNRADFLGVGDFVKVEMKGANRFIGLPEEMRQRELSDWLRKIPGFRKLYWYLYRNRPTFFTQKARESAEPYAPSPDEVGPPSDNPPEDKVVAKLELLQHYGVAAVYAVSIGSSSVKRLMAAGVQPIIVEKGHSIEDLLNRVNAAIHHGGVAWVEQALGRARSGPVADNPLEPERRLEHGWVDPF
ncbi:NifB/NifX family molybdenum-iron cluster-binding protein [Imhoffiella purpurea]|uniref:Putative vanadium nitrogenase protein n=1 Tax=Imhoffiella purpurea TaxID=1249627 RepID=W9V891_9GAMM|nr:NifB/NifX family molybdenum-iron cluster-binding protein [Imhoffiella purpurea]EXJ15793.1 putative vanadium nitrogenase protein [Imhoffiella purpurea]